MWDCNGGAGKIQLEYGYHHPRAKGLKRRGSECKRHFSVNGPISANIARVLDPSSLAFPHKLNTINSPGSLLVFSTELGLLKFLASQTG